MWIWLTISGILVVACIIFGIYSFLSSRNLHRSISAELGFKTSSQPQLNKYGLGIITETPIYTLKSKLRSLDDNALLNTYNISELQKRIEKLEATTSLKTVKDEDKWEDNGEDWEKLFYGTRREKQLLEQEVADLKFSLEGKTKTIKEMEMQQLGWSVMKSEMELKLNNIQSLENIIDELHRKLGAAIAREKEMEEQVAYERSKYVGYELFQKQNNQMQSEIDILTGRLAEINEHNISLQKKLKSLTELGSNLAISEYEKMGIKHSVEQFLQKL